MEIKEFQDRIKKNFFHKDSRRGPEKTYLWLMEEIGELSQAILENDKQNIAEELSDVAAWIFSLANIYGIDLDSAMQDKYPDTCKVCHSSPCICEKKPVK